MGGLASAAALRRVGINVTVYEQASQFTRLGAGIQIGCNAVKVLRGIGLEQKLRQQSFYPRSWNNRDWRTGDVKFDMIFGESAEQKFGAPYLLAHRGDLHAALASAVPDDCIKLSHKLVGLDETSDGVRLAFANGATAVADAVDGKTKSGAVYELGGPEVLTMREIMEIILATTDRKRMLVSLPFGLAKWQAQLLQFAPGPLKLTPDQVALLQSDNVVSDTAKAAGLTLEGLGIAADSLEAIAPQYLWRFRAAGQFQRNGA